MLNHVLCDRSSSPKNLLMKIEVRKSIPVLIFCASIWDLRCNTESCTQFRVTFIGEALDRNFHGLSTVNLLGKADTLRAEKQMAFILFIYFAASQKTTQSLISMWARQEGKTCSWLRLEHSRYQVQPFSFRGLGDTPHCVGDRGGKYLRQNNSARLCQEDVTDSCSHEESWWGFLEASSLSCLLGRAEREMEGTTLSSIPPFHTWRPAWLKMSLGWWGGGVRLNVWLCLLDKRSPHPDTSRRMELSSVFFWQWASDYKCPLESPLSQPFPTTPEESFSVKSILWGCK